MSSSVEKRVPITRTSTPRTDVMKGRPRRFCTSNSARPAVTSIRVSSARSDTTSTRPPRPTSTAEPSASTALVTATSLPNAVPVVATIGRCQGRRATTTPITHAAAARIHSRA